MHRTTLYACPKRPRAAADHVVLDPIIFLTRHRPGSSGSKSGEGAKGMRWDLIVPHLKSSTKV
jgi:hypothetical protein